MEQTTLLKDYSQEEKGAYFGALATMAAVDGKATQEELEFLGLMSEAAELPENVQQEVVLIAKEPTMINLQKCLDVLKGSQLRFSFITDVISFAKADGHYSPEEQTRIQEMADYLDVNQKQYSILEQYVKKADEAQQHGENPTSQSFLSKNGFGEMFKNAGISPQMVQGILGVVAPLVIGRLLSGGRRSRYGSGGMAGGLLGGLLGGGMGMGGGGMYRSGGGLGSIISILGGLNGRKGYGNVRQSGGLGSLLGGLLGGSRR